MKYLKKKQKKRGPVIIGLILVLLVAAAVIILLLNKGNNKVPQTESMAASVETTEVTEAPEATTEPVEVVIEKPVVREYDVVELTEGQIETPYCTLNYPEGLAYLLLVINTSQQPYTLEFYAVMEGKQELRLFDISLGEGSDGNMGMAVTPEGEVPLNVTIYTLTMDETWSENEITTAYAMQDVVNEMIEQLIPKTEEKQTEAPVISQQPDEGSTIHNLEIETPYATLYYPAQWANTVSCVNDDSQKDVYMVRFYSRIEGLENQLLFAIYFGGDEGEQLGAIMGSEGIPVPVNLVMAELKLDGLNEDEVKLLCTMQEASNQLIERLPLLQ